MSTRRQYRYSYSGADARVFVYIPGFEQYAQPLESVHTISFSVHEAKGDARALGHRGVKGFARGIRTVAGSLILTVIEDHPLRVLMNQLGAVLTEYDRDNGTSYGLWPGWSVDRDENGVGQFLNRSNPFNRFASTIPPFNLAIQYVSEGGNFSRTERSLAQDRLGQPNTGSGLDGYDVAGAHLLIEEIEFIDEGYVTSVADIVTEMSFSFKARDAKPLSKLDFQVADIQRFKEDSVRQAALMRKLTRRAERINERVSDILEDGDFPSKRLQRRSVRANRAVWEAENPAQSWEHYLESEEWWEKAIGE